MEKRKFSFLSDVHFFLLKTDDEVQPFGNLIDWGQRNVIENEQVLKIKPKD